MARSSYLTRDCLPDYNTNPITTPTIKAVIIVWTVRSNMRYCNTFLTICFSFIILCLLYEQVTGERRWVRAAARWIVPQGLNLVLLCPSCKGSGLSVILNSSYSIGYGIPICQYHRLYK